METYKIKKQNNDKNLTLITVRTNKTTQKRTVTEEIIGKKTLLRS